MRCTVQDVVLETGGTQVHRSRDHVTQMTSLVLAQPYRTFPAGTEIGRLQTTQYFCGFQTSASFTHGKAVTDHDRDWLVREFKEEECGERQARIDRIQPGQAYRVGRFFGYLPHEICCYEPGGVIEVMTQTDESVETKVTHPGKRPRVVRWNRKAFVALVESFALLEQN